MYRISFLRPKLFVNLWTFRGRNFTSDLVIAKLNCVHFFFILDSVPFGVSKWTFWVIFSQIDFRVFFSVEKTFVPLKHFSNYPESEIFNLKKFWRRFWKFRGTFWLIQNFDKNEEVDPKAERSLTQTGTQYLCITNKQLSVHASSVEKDVAKDKDGYSIQLTEWERGNRGELLAAEPAPSRVVRSSVPHLGISTAWPRSPGQ